MQTTPPTRSLLPLRSSRSRVGGDPGKTRIATWFLSTVTVVVLMFGYHTSTSGVQSTATPPAITSGTDSGSGSDSSSTPSTQHASGSSGTSTVSGSVAQTMWGPVQVELSVKSDRVTGVRVVQYPNGNPRDGEINSYALPILIQETLDAQSARIDMVSGATVTSVGYQQSLQSALDQAGL
jgi:uncharacterized protein with FMN-binding domain